MSVQFGRWNFNGVPAAPEYLAKVRQILSPYGPDGGGSYSNGGVDLLYCALHATKESRLETQPHVFESSSVITWDGRLDNRTELIGLLNGYLSTDSTDVSIVAAAYQHWGTDCFAKLIGDWALSVWNPHERSLVLAKDPIGTRHLYCSVERDQVTWSTILDPLVLLVAKPFRLSEEYVAGWFSLFPATHLTPYVGVQAVPPSSFLLVKDGKSTTYKYWDFDPDKRIRYRSDTEYEEHFRFVFAQSVRRRLRSDTPVLAELSGGMDSSSIVCVADIIMACGGAETRRVDTLSYYDDSEPNWNERPYFTTIEERRGRTGCHIDVGVQEAFTLNLVSDRFAATPSSVGHPSEATKQFAHLMTSQGNRAVLSGVGGDEVTGGVPTPTPELADLIATGQFRSLAHQLKAWALIKRRPWLHLLVEALRGFCPDCLVGVPKHYRPVPWLYPAFAKRHRAALIGYERRLKPFGPLPSFQDNLNTLDGLRRQLACFVPSAEPPYEKRYPYLDRDLLEFIYAIPRQQLVRPGERRSLMRRTLAGIVPDEVLNRKRKAFVSRYPRLVISADWAKCVEMIERMATNSLGIVDSTLFREAVGHARDGREVSIVPLFRTMAVEMWVRTVADFNLLCCTQDGANAPNRSLSETGLHAACNPRILS